jgi:predicted nucleic acid-binding protein
MIKIDASSLIISLKMDFFEVLNELYQDLIITEAIYQEVIINGKNKGKPEAIIGEKLIKEDKITIHKVDEELMDLKLGLGETEVIHNSIKNECPCMMEDKKAKKIAESFNLDVRKIPISMLEAYQNKLIDTTEFEDYLLKWVKYASPSYEEVYFVKKMKELLNK